MRRFFLYGLAALSSMGCAHSGRAWYQLEPQTQPLAMEAPAGCPVVEGSGPLVVLVHGIGGDTQNTPEVRAELGKLEPAAILAFRWSPLEETQALLRRFADGLEQASHCTLEGRQVVVVAHSAGGVLASMAIESLTLHPEVQRQGLVLLTVASPLAGHGYSSWRTALFSRKPFLMTLGGGLEAYPAPPQGVSVFHLRTHPASDHVMRPTPRGHWPDHPAAVVPGAIEHALPVEVGHDEALLWAARELVERPARFGVTARVPQ